MMTRRRWALVSSIVRRLYRRRHLAIMRSSLSTLELHRGLGLIIHLLNRSRYKAGSKNRFFPLFRTVCSQQSIRRSLCCTHVQALSQSLTCLGLRLLITHFIQPPIRLVSSQKSSTSVAYDKHHTSRHQWLLSSSRHEIGRLEISNQCSIATIAHLRVGPTSSTAEDIVLGHETGRIQYGSS